MPFASSRRPTYSTSRPGSPAWPGSGTQVGRTVIRSAGSPYETSMSRMKGVRARKRATPSFQVRRWRSSPIVTGTVWIRESR